MFQLCGGAETTDAPSDVTSNPTILVEVLSESTKDYDRGGKFEHYRRLASLKEYLLVGQDKAHVEQFIRQPNGEWICREVDGLSGQLLLPSLNVELPLAEIYDKVEFEWQNPK
jgi:Uma2 family endonuclease